MKWVVVGSIGLMGLIALLDAPALRGPRMGRERVFFWSVWTLAAVLLLLVALDVDLPNPLDGINAVFQPMSRMMLRLLE